MCETLTDNHCNRTGPELRSIFSKLGGEIGKSGCVSYLFERKGLFIFDTEAVDEETVMEVALENGGDDVETTDDGKLQVTCARPDQFHDLEEALSKAELAMEVKEVTRFAPNNG